MSEEPAPEPVPLAAQQGRARQSPLWKGLFGGAIVCTCLLAIEVPFGVSAQSPQKTADLPSHTSAVAVASAGAGMSSKLLEADRNCNSKGPMNMAPVASPPMSATVTGFLSDAEATALLVRTEAQVNGKLDPAYLHNVRAVLHPSLAKNPKAWVIVVVPESMNVTVGETVRIVGGHASPTIACTYVPNLIVVGSPAG